MPIISKIGSLTASAFGFANTLIKGEQVYTTPGTYSWTCPEHVYSVSVVCIGGGSAGRFASLSNFGCGGGGGALAYKNNMPVIPGNTYTVIVGDYGQNAFSIGFETPGGDSSFNGTLIAGGGNTLYAGNNGGLPSGSYDGGGAGGSGGSPASGGYQGGAGGGAGGYSGNGGNASNGYSVGQAPQTDSGGGASGGHYSAGGGVGIYGKGADGAVNWYGGGGGSDGQDGSGNNGGQYGGGGAGAYPGHGGSGAVRIIWPGNFRSFPSTNM